MKNEYHLVFIISPIFNTLITNFLPLKVKNQKSIPLILLPVILRKIFAYLCIQLSSDENISVFVFLTYFCDATWICPTGTDPCQAGYIRI